MCRGGDGPPAQRVQVLSLRAPSGPALSLVAGMRRLGGPCIPREGPAADSRLSLLRLLSGVLTLRMQRLEYGISKPELRVRAENFGRAEVGKVIAHRAEDGADAGAF